MSELLAQEVRESTEVELNKPCKGAVWTPEVHDFYGDPEAILAKMDNTDMELGQRRMYALLTESAEHADVRFFEQVDGKQYAVATWTGDSLDGLNGRLAETILTNKGVHCVGEQTRELLSELGMSLEATVPSLANPRAAFAHTVRAHGDGEFTRATTALLC